MAFAHRLLHRRELVAGLVAASDAMPPEALLQRAEALVRMHLYGVELLQALYPDPEDAAIALASASGSMTAAAQLGQLLLPSRPGTTLLPSSCSGGDDCGAALLRLLKQVVLEALSQGNCGSSTGKNDCRGKATAPTDAVASYAADLVVELLGAAQQHPVLLLCLCHAACACTAQLEPPVLQR